MPRMPALTSICAACILATWAKPPSVRIVVKTSSPIISPRSKSRKLGATLDVVDLLGGDPRRDGLGGPRREGRTRRTPLEAAGAAAGPCRGVVKNNVSRRLLSGGEWLGGGEGTTGINSTLP